MKVVAIAVVSALLVIPFAYIWRSLLKPLDWDGRTCKYAGRVSGVVPKNDQAADFIAVPATRDIPEVKEVQNISAGEGPNK